MPPTVTITPKSRFCEDKKRAAAHRELVVSTNFLSASEAALLTMIDDIAESTDPAVAIAGYNRIVGARKFMKALNALAEESKAITRGDSFNLNHKIT